MRHVIVNAHASRFGHCWFEYHAGPASFFVTNVAPPTEPTRAGWPLAPFVSPLHITLQNGGRVFRDISSQGQKKKRSSSSSGRVWPLVKLIRARRCITKESKEAKQKSNPGFGGSVGHAAGIQKLHLFYLSTLPNAMRAVLLHHVISFQGIKWNGLFMPDLRSRLRRYMAGQIFLR